MSTSIVFIDSRVQDYQTLVSSLATGIQGFVVSPDREGLVQIASILANFQNLDSIQVISHGSAGMLYLGSRSITTDSLTRYETELKTIGASLSETGDILLYGCNVGAGEAGQSFVAQLAKLTGADVAASDDLTGAGGDWELELQSGSIDAEGIRAGGYNGVLTTVATSTVTITGAGSTTDAGATVDTSYNVKIGDYFHTIAGFGPGDKIIFSSGSSAALNYPTVVNSSFSDGIVSIQLAQSGTLTTITLTGLTTTQDAGIFGLTSFKSLFGADSVTNTASANTPSANTAPTLNTPTALSYIDTPADEIFIETNGTLSASGGSGSFVYGISGGTDDGASVFKIGTYGSLYITKATGVYTFFPADTPIEALKTNSSETFTVTVTDGTATSNATLTVNLTGADDTTTFSGSKAGSLTKDSVTTATGTLAVSDRDTGDAGITAQTNASGTYGTFSIGTNGIWNYALNNTATNVQALKAGETVTDSFTVTTAGGSTQAITLSIAGTGTSGSSGLNVVTPSKPGTYTGGSASDLIESGSLGDKITAGEGNNVISAGEGNNVISAGSGNDQITAGSGTDKITDGGGDNTINAGGGNNTVTTGSGADSITTGNGTDKITAGDGKNTIVTGNGNKTITTGSGNDQITTGKGTNKINAGDGANKIIAGDGINTITTGSGNDTITSGAGKDKITAGAGDDRIDSGAGKDQMTGGDGVDTFVLGAPVVKTNLDTISDFTEDDILELPLSVFTQLATTHTEGNLAIDKQKSALDADDYLIYDSKTGKLYYDVDGSGSTAAIQIAGIKGTGAKTLSIDDFSFV